VWHTVRKCFACCTVSAVTKCQCGTVSKCFACCTVSAVTECQCGTVSKCFACCTVSAVTMCQCGTVIKCFACCTVSAVTECQCGTLSASVLHAAHCSMCSEVLVRCLFGVDCDGLLASCVLFVILELHS
jgi:hypothetical protein